MDNYVYRNFTRESLGKAYDNTSAVKNSSEILEGFNARSAEISKQFQDTMNLHYGMDSRERIDYFSCGKQDAPLFVFIQYITLSGNPFLIVSITASLFESL